MGSLRVTVWRRRTSSSVAYYKWVESGPFRVHGESWWMSLIHVKLYCGEHFTPPLCTYAKANTHTGRCSIIAECPFEKEPLNKLKHAANLQWITLWQSLLGKADLRWVRLIYSFATLQCLSLHILKYDTKLFDNVNMDRVTDWTSEHSFLWSGVVPEFGTMRCPPWELKEPRAVQDGSRVRSSVWVWVRRPMVLSLLSSRQCGSLGDSLEESSPPRSSCGVTKPEELYTLIFRLGSGSSSGELVMGILSATSCRA